MKTFSKQRSMLGNGRPLFILHANAILFIKGFCQWPELHGCISHDKITFGSRSIDLANFIELLKDTDFVLTVGFSFYVHLLKYTQVTSIAMQYIGQHTSCEPYFLANTCSRLCTCSAR